MWQNLASADRLMNVDVILSMELLFSQLLPVEWAYFYIIYLFLPSADCLFSSSPCFILHCRLTGMTALREQKKSVPVVHEQRGMYKHSYHKKCLVLLWMAGHGLVTCKKKRESLWRREFFMLLKTLTLAIC